MSKTIILLLLTTIACISKADSFLSRLAREYAAIDTNYVEPNKYVFTAMMQGTTHFERYILTDDNERRLHLSPDQSLKIGPYVGYEWIVVGYQIDAIGHKDNVDFNLSYYLPVGGIDFYSKRKTNNFDIRGLRVPGFESADFERMEFSGLNTSALGLDLYYVLNHKKYSLRAAYSQTTRQVRSQGSVILGMGYNKQEAKLDYDVLRESLADRYGEETAGKIIPDTLHSTGLSLRYLTLQGGYGYNWVFARNCLLNTTLSVALGYVHYLDMHSNGDSYIDQLDLQTFNKLKVDGTFRLGIVWNNSKYYCGATAILHGYNFHIKNIHLMNGYGTIHAYVGVNFDIGRIRKH